MTASPARQLTDVTRTVTRVDDGYAVTLSQVFPVHPEELWSALTIGSHLEVWFGRASGEVVEGSRYELPDMEARGTVLAAEEPRRLLLSWEQGRTSRELELLVEPVEQEADAAASEMPGAESAAADGGTAGQPGATASDDHPDATAPGNHPDATMQPVATRFTLRHTVPEDAHWKTFGPAATGCGWDGALYGLALHLEDPSADVLWQLGRFAASPQGAEFTRATAEAWFEAHVAAGADKKPARKASVRTAAFYLGEEPELA